ncbi:MAG: chorismate mutase [Oscillospiraceae bacterium]|nr:chorismate mutase [Oscillospiraceae bacterium]
MDLDQLRTRITALDGTIQAAFAERMELCRQVALYKQAHGM